jgi:uncharacterized protein with GYD domain
MATFIMTGRYSTEAIKRISGERTTKATDIVQQCGGKLVAAYATMGETDLLVIVEFPGVGEAIRASVALNKALGLPSPQCLPSGSRSSTSWSASRRSN